MKRLSIILFAFMLILPSSAHSGRTDANGGHYDRSTGEYHYHTGEYAGQKQYPKSPKKSENPAPEDIPHVKSNDTPDDEPDNEPNNDFEFILNYTFSAAVFIFYVGMHYSIRTENMYKNYRIEEYSRERELEKMLPPEFCAPKYPVPIKLYVPPPGVKFNASGLPEGSFETPKGLVGYTVYVTQYGNKYHHSFCRYAHSQGIVAKNYFEVRTDCKPCSLCESCVPTDWYDNAEIINLF